MNKASWTAGVLVGCVMLSGARSAWAQDWPQWRGPNRDAKVSGFKVPQTWPKELTQKWKVKVGNGDATPALVGDKLYVFTLQEGNEVRRCLDAATGKELWTDKYPANGATPRRTSSTCSRLSDMVRITTSTVTANAGNCDGS